MALRRSAPLRRTARHRSPHGIRRHSLCSRAMHTTPAKGTALARRVPLRRTARHRARTMRRPYTVLQTDAHSARHSYGPGTRCAPRENSATQGTHHASPIHCAPEGCTQRPPQLQPWHTVCPLGEQRDTGHAPCVAHTLCSRQMHTMPATATALAHGVPLRRTAHRAHRAIHSPYKFRSSCTPV